MSNLLDLAVEAHGGLRRWRELTSITASLSLGGTIWTDKGWVGAFDDVTVTIDPHVQRVSFAPFTAPSRRSLFTSDRVALETAEGDLIDERINPRVAFDGHSRETQWDDLHLAYFTGCALWTC